MIEENVRSGGFGQKVRDRMAELGLADVEIKLITLPDDFVEHGTQPILRAQVGLDSASIANAIVDLVSASKMR